LIDSILKGEQKAIIVARRRDESYRRERNIAKLQPKIPGMKVKGAHKIPSKVSKSLLTRSTTSRPVNAGSLNEQVSDYFI